MTFEQAMQVVGLAVTGVTTLAGYSRVAAKLKNYVTVDDYRSKVAALHEQINTLTIQVVRLEERAKQ